MAPSDKWFCFTQRISLSCSVHRRCSSSNRPICPPPLLFDILKSISPCVFHDPIWVRACFLPARDVPGRGSARANCHAAYSGFELTHISFLFNQILRSHLFSLGQWPSTSPRVKWYQNSLWTLLVFFHPVRFLIAPESHSWIWLGQAYFALSRAQSLEGLQIVNFDQLRVMPFHFWVILPFSFTSHSRSS